MLKRGFKRKILTKIKNSQLVEERHEQIFQAAFKFIQKKGYHRTTIRDLSKETGISLGNFYDYINTKEDILYIVHEKARKIVDKAIGENMSNVGDPVQQLKGMIEKELKTIDKYQDLIMSIYQESHALSKSSLKCMLSSEEVHMERYKKVLEEGIKSGVFKPNNTTMLANIIKMMIDCWVIRRWALRGKVGLEEMEDGLVGMVLGGIMFDKKNRS